MSGGSDNDNELRLAVTEAIQWLGSASVGDQRAWFSQLAECLTVVIRSSIHEPVQVGTIQMVNEFLHCVVGRIAAQDLGHTEMFSAAETLRMVGLAIARAESINPPPDPSVIAQAIRHTLDHFRPPKST